MTLLEARDAGAAAAASAGATWTFDRIYLRAGEWIAVLRRPPAAGDLAALWIGGKRDLAARMAFSGATAEQLAQFDGSSLEQARERLTAVFGRADRAPRFLIVRHVPVGRL